MDVVREEVRKCIDKELEHACKKFSMFSTLHEAYAVTLEEMQEAEEELNNVKRFMDLEWKQIRLNNSELSCCQASRVKYAAERLAIEAIQVAAMAQKTIDSQKSLEKHSCKNCKHPACQYVGNGDGCCGNYVLEG